jgi:allophanate hydrolase-like protein
VPLMFLTGDGMRGGRLHHHIAGATLIGERRTLPRYRFYSVRDEYPALCPVAEGGGQILGELYDVPMTQLHGLLAREPPELELSIVELAAPEPAAPGSGAPGSAAGPGSAALSFGMILRRGELERGAHPDITRYGGWRAYRAAG